MFALIPKQRSFGEPCADFLFPFSTFCLIRLLRGESFAESSVNGSSPQASPNLMTPMFSPTEEEPAIEATSGGQPQASVATSETSVPQPRSSEDVDAGGTVRGGGTSIGATDSDKWSQDGSEYGEESHYGASPYTAPMRLSEVSAYSRNDYSRLANGDRGKEEPHTPTFAFDQALANDSRPTSYVPSSLGTHGEGANSADQSQSTSVISVPKSSPLASYSTLAADVNPSPQGQVSHLVTTHPTDFSDDLAGDSRARSSTGGESINESVTESLDEMLNQIGTHNFSNSLPERSHSGTLHHLSHEEDDDLGEYDVMRRSTEEAVRAALVGSSSDFTHERTISRSSSHGSIGNARSSTPGSPRAFNQLRSPVSPRKNSLEDIRITTTATESPSGARIMSQSPRQRFKDLPPSPSLLPTFTNSPRSPNLDIASTSPRSAGSEFDLS